MSTKKTITFLDCEVIDSGESLKDSGIPFVSISTDSPEKIIRQAFSDYTDNPEDNGFLVWISERPGFILDALRFIYRRKDIREALDFPVGDVLEMDSFLKARKLGPNETFKI